jgi:predicted RecB family nuclease
LLVWFDLNAPAHATITPQVDADGSVRFHKRSGKNRRTALERYDFEFAFRLNVADAADSRTSAKEPALVFPVKIKECERCPWNQVCDAELRGSDDVSLVCGVGHPEWSIHRHLGNATTESLAGLDVDTAAALDRHGDAIVSAHTWALGAEPTAPTQDAVSADIAERFATAESLQSLCERTLAYNDTPIKPSNLLKQIENARSFRAGGPIIRQPVKIPRGDIEIDFDLECLVNPAQVYLWGALVTHQIADWPEPSGSYTSFASFEPMTVESEAQLVAELWAWFQRQLDNAERHNLTVRVYGYNLTSTETSHLVRIAAGGAAPGLPTPDELAEFTEHGRFVDLYPYMKGKWISNDGHSLKVMAPAHGFQWSDDEPSGLNSIAWYKEAVDGNAEMIERVLAYNADDCRATLALRE